LIFLDFYLLIGVFIKVPITIEEALAKISRIKKNEYIEDYNI